MKVVIVTVHQANYEVYGVRKMWKAMRRTGEDIGRDQVGRLMRELGIEGVRRGRKVRTTRPDEKANRPPDLVERRFVAERKRVVQSGLAGQCCSHDALAGCITVLIGFLHGGFLR